MIILRSLLLMASVGLFIILSLGCSTGNNQAMEEEIWLISNLTQKAELRLEQKTFASALQNEESAVENDVGNDRNSDTTKEEEIEEETPGEESMDEGENEEKGDKETAKEVETPSSKDDKQENGGEQMRGSVTFKVLTESELMGNYERAYQYYSSTKNQDIRDWRVFSENEMSVIVISGGMKNTGGHYIEVMKVENKEGMTVIQVKEHAPGPGDMVTQVMNNPIVVISVKASELHDVIEVINDKGQPFEKHSSSAY
ncbi:protease complex subunit PrcB family protein [Evansella sp. AB-rgal1]|uniref:protease complex subunit PrcB family protein n=1 Tax=Evansella sp. AB-rgal1 TaxID=3242696 RepID=UPI00359CBDC7